MKLLVTGGRDFADEAMVKRVLDSLHAKYNFTLLIHGDASGLDRLAGAWAHETGIEVLDW